jgi:hypothetical protein
MQISFDNCTAMYKDLYTLAGFKPWTFCSGGRRDDPYATAPGQGKLKLCARFCSTGDVTNDRSR